MRKLLVWMLVLIPAHLLAQNYSTPFNGRLSFKADQHLTQTIRQNSYKLAKLDERFGEGKFNLKYLFKVPSKEKFLENYYRSEMNQWFILEWDKNQYQTVDIVNILNNNTNIVEIVPETPIQICMLPDDYSNYDLYTLDIMACEEAWEIQAGAENILIAVLDTGIEPLHEDLTSQLWINPGEDLNENGIWDESDNNGIDDDENGYIDDLLGYDFVSVPEDEVVLLGAQPVEGQDYGPVDNDVSGDYIGHGTFVSGIAAGSTNNGIGIASISWGASIMPVRIAMPAVYLGQETALITPIDLALAVQYAAENGADIINMSFGFTANLPNVETAMSNAYINGIVLVGGTGNYGNTEFFYPAAYDYVIGVAAVDANLQRAVFSNYGNWVTLAVPGVDIMSTTPDYGLHTALYSQHSGTSAATPFVSGAVALLMAAEPGISPFLIENRLEQACINIDEQNPGLEGQLGAGLLNLHYLLDPEVISVDESNYQCPDEYNLVKTWPNPFNSSVRISINVKEQSTLKLSVFDILGRQIAKLHEDNVLPGLREYTWDANGFSSGNYFLKVESLKGSRLQRITLVR